MCEDQKADEAQESQEPVVVVEVRLPGLVGEPPPWVVGPRRGHLERDDGQKISSRELNLQRQVDDSPSGGIGDEFGGVRRTPGRDSRASNGDGVTRFRC